MATPNHEKYQDALDRTACGDWHIDAEAGQVFGIKGQPIGSVNASGYIVLTMAGDKSNVLLTAHRLIWCYVHGIPANDDQVNHINGTKTDNRIANLELVTASRNVQHAVELGLKVGRPGQRHHNARLTPEDVQGIRTLAALGVPQSELARRYGVSRGHLSAIVNGHKWAAAAA